ncbi:outer membrane beta-barrel protein [Erythrobacter sp. LQ02-29]|uniref:outer membrane beta-barrel protein n=1 Tax=Erythrobacter sp. LQ02-29 TaxID=2920384 RepID=UPI001F4DF14F|nr:outer membrane beta-barrel protein [Erythrobacter sp. LQ02-29]
MNRPILRATVATLALCMASAAHAQSVKDDMLSLGFELQLRHDSNVANSSDERTAQRGLVKAEQIISPAATIALRRAFGPHSVQLSGYVGYDFHTRNTRLDSERISLDATGDIKASLCRVSPTISYSRAQSELGYQLLDTDPTLVVDNTQSEQTYSADLSCGPPIGLRAQGGFGYSRGDNSNLRRQTSDYETYNYRTGVGYTQPSIGEISLYVSKQDTTFPNRVFSGGERDGYTVRRYGASFARDIGARLSGSFGYYYIDVDSRAPVSRDFQGSGYNLDLSLVATPRTRLRFNINKDVQTALNNDALYTRTGSYGVAADYAVNERLTIDAGYRFENRRYVYSGFLAPVADRALLNDKFQTVTANATYRPSQKLSFTLFGGYENRNANGTFFDYDGYFVGLTGRIALVR